MRKGKASNTAQFVAFNRALANLQPVVPGFSDPIAEKLLPPRWQKRLAAARRALPKSPIPFWMKGMAVFNQFRTVVLDRETALLPQLVILGAGFDGRAYRLALPETAAFEVDHPDTQRLKKEKASTLSPSAQSVRFVPVDFSQDELAPNLAEAGFDPRRRTQWLWEGVTMYLSPADVQKTLQALAHLSAPGSRLALTYLAKAEMNFRQRFALWAFNTFIKEPMRSSFTVEELDALAKATGWQTVSNTGITDWLVGTGVALTEKQVGLQWNERVWVGVTKSAVRASGTT